MPTDPGSGTETATPTGEETGTTPPATGEQQPPPPPPPGGAGPGPGGPGGYHHRPPPPPPDGSVTGITDVLNTAGGSQPVTFLRLA